MPLVRYRSELDAEAKRYTLLQTDRLELSQIFFINLDFLLSIIPESNLWPLVGIFAAIITIP